MSAEILEKIGAGGDITLAIASPSSPLAVLGFRDGTVEVWSLEPIARLHRLKQEVFPVTSVAESGGVIATWRFGSLPNGAARYDLTFWRPARLEVVAAEKQGSGNLVSGGFLEEGTHFLSCEDNGFESSWFMVVRETATGRIVDRQPTENRRSGTLWIHPDGTTAVLSHYGNTGPGVSIWQFEGGKLKQLRSHPSIESNVAIYDKVRNRLISGVFTIEEEPGLSLGVHHARSGREMPALSPVPATVFGTTISLSTDPDGRRFILGNYHRSIGFCTIGSLEDGQHRSFEIEGIHTTQFREQYAGAYGWTNKKDAVTISSDGRRAYVVEQAGSLRALAITPENQFEEVARLVSLTDGDWAIIDDQGNYCCSPAAAEKMAFRFRDRALSFASFDQQFNRPARLARVLGASPDFVSDLEAAYRERLVKLSQEAAELSFEIPPVRLNHHLPLATTDSSIRMVTGASALRQVIYRNGLLLHDNPGSPGTRPREIEVALSAGTNRIELFHIDSAGNRSIPVTHSCYHAPLDSPESRLFVLAIGVSEYQDERLKLAVASKDALDITRGLEKHGAGIFTDVITRTIVDEEATRENILDAAAFFGDAEINDSVIVFLAGHGFLDAKSLSYYFGTVDVDYRRVDQRGLAYDELQKLFRECPASNRLILMDTCFAGEVETFDIEGPQSTGHPALSARAIALAKAPKRRRESQVALRRTLFSDIRRSSGANVITASGGMEFVFAMERNDVGNGLFTHCVLDSLGNVRTDTDGNGVISVSELFESVRLSLREISEGAQEPSMREINRFADFPISRGGEVPHFDARAFLLELIALRGTDGREADYARLFTPNCRYFDETKNPAEIEIEERAFQKAFPTRRFEIAGPPEVEPISGGRFRVKFRLHTWRFDRETYEEPKFNAGQMDVQNVESIVGYRDRRWLIEKMGLLSSRRIANPHLIEH